MAKNEPKKQKPTARAEAWVNQMIEQFGDTDITAGSDFLQSDFTAINDLPDELIPYWGGPGQDLTAMGYAKADPQPEHEMTARGHVLWLTRKDMYIARKERERVFSQTRMQAAGEENISGPVPQGANGEIQGVSKSDGDWH